MPKREVESASLAQAVRRMMRALVNRAADGDLDAVRELYLLHRDCDAMLGEAVRSHRRVWSYSWAYMGQALGMSRQAAQQRWGRPS